MSKTCYLHTSFSFFRIHTINWPKELRTLCNLPGKDACDRRNELEDLRSFHSVFLAHNLIGFNKDRTKWNCKQSQIKLERTPLRHSVFLTPNPTKPSNLDWIAFNLHQLPKIFVLEEITYNRYT